MSFTTDEINNISQMVNDIVASHQGITNAINETNNISQIVSTTMGHVVSIADDIPPPIPPRDNEVPVMDETPKISPEVLPTPRRGFLPSIGEKIRQSVETGSAFLALDCNFFTPLELLQWLTEVPMTEKTQIAYKALCTKINPNIQWLADGYHFLIGKSEYTSIAVGFQFSMETPDRRPEPGIATNQMVVHLCDALIQINTDQNFRKNSAFILNGMGTLSYIQSRLVTCFRARNFPHLPNVSANEINIALVTSDWTGKFRYNESLPKLIIRRAASLQRDAPIYYAGVAYAAYHKVAVKLYKDKLLIQLSKDELSNFNVFFPNIIDIKVLDYSDLAYKIALLGNDVAGYVLGFPIQNMIPNDEQIHEAINILTVQGADAYAEHIKKYVKSTYTPIPPFPQKEVSYSNDTDVMMVDEIDDFVPFDIVSYQHGPHMYRFTRAEFSKLAESKKNPWTNDWFPVTVLSTIISRAHAAKELGLPVARPCKELLARIESGTLFTADEEPKPRQQQPAAPRQDELSQVLFGLLGREIQQLEQEQQEDDNMPQFENGADMPEDDEEYEAQEAQDHNDYTLRNQHVQDEYADLPPLISVDNNLLVHGNVLRRENNAPVTTITDNAPVPEPVSQETLQAIRNITVLDFEHLPVENSNWFLAPETFNEFTNQPVRRAPNSVPGPSSDLGQISQPVRSQNPSAEQMRRQRLERFAQATRPVPSNFMNNGGNAPPNITLPINTPSIPSLPPCPPFPPNRDVDQ